MSKWAKQIKFLNSSYADGKFSFTFDVDGEELQLELTHSIPSTLPMESIVKIGFNLGMCYLVDLAEITLARKVWIYKKLDPVAMAYWNRLLEEVVVEKLYELKLPTALKYFEWETGYELQDIRICPLPEGRSHAALCLTGGKESMSILKTLEGKKPLLLLFLDPETNVHRQRVYETVKDSFLTTKTISNRKELFAPLIGRYDGLQSGVDMAHLVFHAMLYADKCEYVLIGNEYSSNISNDIYEGSVVNHQYVKTLHFAEQLNRYVHTFVTDEFSYHSPFFGMYEVLIADLLFNDEKYLEVWTSCNQTTPEVNFCSKCYKCAFTYLVAHTKKSEEFLLKFFDHNMLNDVELYKPLMDFVGMKPLDCVGDKVEVWVCLEELALQGLSYPVIFYYVKNIRPQIVDELEGFKKQILSVQNVPLPYPKDIEKIFLKALGK